MLNAHMLLRDNVCEKKTATNLQIDDQLITKAVKLGGHRTKKTAVTQALTEYIQNIEQKNILSLFGSVDFDPNYDYKKQRSRA